MEELTYKDKLQKEYDLDKLLGEAPEKFLPIVVDVSVENTGILLTLKPKGKASPIAQVYLLPSQVVDLIQQLKKALLETDPREYREMNKSNKRRRAHGYK